MIAIKQGNYRLLTTSLFVIVGTVMISTAAAIIISSVLYIKAHGGISSSLLLLDSRAFITGADLVASWPEKDLYNPQAQFAAQQLRFNAHQYYDSPLIFVYPPFVAVALSPLAALDNTSAYLVLLLWNAILLLFCIVMIRKLMRGHDGRIRAMALLGLVSFLPLLQALLNSQSSVLLLVSLLGAWVLFEHEKPYFAGACLSLLAIKPYLLLLPLIAIISMRQLRALMGVCFGILILLIAGQGAGGFEVWISWLELGEYIMQLETPHFGVNPEDMFTLRSLLMALLGTDNSLTVHVVWFFIMALVSVSIFMIFHEHRKWNPHSTPLVWGGMIIAMVLISPHANMHDILLLYLPCLAMGRYVAGNGLGLESKTAIVCMVAWITPLFFPVMISSNQTPIYMVLLMIFLIISISLIYRRGLVTNSISIVKRND
jgi:hypothetical protein